MKISQKTDGKLYQLEESSRYYTFDFEKYNRLIKQALESGRFKNYRELADALIKKLHEGTKKLYSLDALEKWRCNEAAPKSVKVVNEIEKFFGVNTNELLNSADYLKIKKAYSTIKKAIMDNPLLLRLFKEEAELYQEIYGWIIESQFCFERVKESENSSSKAAVQERTQKEEDKHGKKLLKHYNDDKFGQLRFDSVKFKEIFDEKIKNGYHKTIKENRQDLISELEDEGIEEASLNKWRGKKASPKSLDYVERLASCLGLESKYELLIPLEKYIQLEKKYKKYRENIKKMPYILQLFKEDKEFYQQFYDENVAIKSIKIKRIEENEIQIFVDYEVKTEIYEQILNKEETIEEQLEKFAHDYLLLDKEEFDKVCMGIQEPIVRVQIEIIDESEIEISAYLDDDYPTEFGCEDISFEISGIEEAEDMDPDDCYGMDDFTSEDIEMLVRENLDEFAFTEYEKEECVIESII